MQRRPIAPRAAILIAGCALYPIFAPVAAQAGDADAPMRPAEGVSVIAGGFEPGEQPDGNTVVFDAPEGRVVVDTGRHPRHAQRILDDGGPSARPIAAIVNSHWHLDHVSGNDALRTAWPAAEVHASTAIDGALAGFLARYRRQLEEAIAGTDDPTQAARWREEIARIDLGPRLRPTVPVVASGMREIAGKSFRLGLVEAMRPQQDGQVLSGRRRRRQGRLSPLMISSLWRRNTVALCRHAEDRRSARPLRRR